MFVICDIEWAINDKKQISLTQIAASRVNEKWHTLESFFSLARPQNASFEDWEQVCYAGHKSIDFLHAPSAYTVLLEFEAWLKEDDIIAFCSVTLSEDSSLSYNIGACSFCKSEESVERLTG